VNGDTEPTFALQYDEEASETSPTYPADVESTAVSASYSSPATVSVVEVATCGVMDERKSVGEKSCHVPNQFPVEVETYSVEELRKSVGANNCQVPSQLPVVVEMYPVTIEEVTYPESFVNCEIASVVVPYVVEFVDFRKYPVPPGAGTVILIAETDALKASVNPTTKPISIFLLEAINVVCRWNGHRCCECERNPRPALILLI